MASERVGSVRRILPAFRVEAARFLEAQERELKGRRTGQPGAGKVSDALGQVGGLLGNLSNEIETALAKAQIIEQRLNASLDEMKKQVFRQGPIAPRMEAVSSIADRIDADLALLSRFDFRVSIRAGLASLEKLVPAPTPAKTPWENIQNAELAQIAEMTKPVAEALRAALDALDVGSSEPPARSRPVDAMTATKIYWMELLPFYIAAVFLDLSPAFLLVILIAARREVEARATATFKSRGVP